MAKRISNLLVWHESNPNQPHATLQLIAVPIFILAALLLLDAVMSASLTSLGVGVIGLFAALGLQRHGQGKNVSQTP